MSRTTALKDAELPAAHTEVSPSSEQALAALDEARQGTLALIAGLTDEDLERVHSSIMSPLVWDLGHIAAYEDLWIAHRHGEQPLLRPELANLYDAFETPRAVRGEIEALGPREAREYMAAVRERSAAVISSRGVGNGVLCEMVLRHELQHTETMRQTLEIAGLLPAGEPPLPAQDVDRANVSGCDEEWVQIPAGPFEMGAAAEGFAYDNERPRHAVEVGAFRIARRPVSNASWMHFSEGGGYERREWWSQEGWAWKEEYDITRHPAIAAARAAGAGGGLQFPACHVSWFEADAYARSLGARLPTEAEWEKAATWEQRDDEGIEAVGQVWEWTASHFAGYPGFVAYPYPEYSEVFFGEDYRVLRGGSWATHPRVAARTFRNWDLPQRRQIFAGVRLARDSEGA